ncbi:MAG: B12-binding domain-containing radical SAM protein [Firmicutes bacterium]|nr:B12-binding domain-containing radical SAM protein [Bacillota bacterium]
MRYEGNIFRPPSEAYSLLVQVTIGCTHNKCTFCSMYKDKKFRIRDPKEVLEDLAWARAHYRQVNRIFLCDGDALALTNGKLMPILEFISENFPECERVTAYARATDVLRKSEEELRQLRDAGITMVYIGAESGSDAVLSQIHKGETRRQLIDGVRKAENCGIQASVTFISGLAGKAGWEDHAVQTGTMISEMQPSYVGLLTLMVDPDVPIAEEIRSGRLQLLSPEEVMEETALLLENTEVTKPCVFRSNHASNYLSLRGNLPRDKEAMMRQLRRAMKDSGMLKDERFRAL